MNSTLNNLPFPTSLLPPPYEQFHRLSGLAALGAAPLAPGTVVAVHVGAGTPDLAALARWVPTLRARLPAAPVVLHLDSASGKEMLHLASRAGALRVRALLTPGDPMPDALRRVLTDPEEVPAHVVEWLGVRGVPCSPVLGHLVQRIFAHAGRHAEVADLLRAIGEPETSARFRFRKKGLPSPRRWLQAARALRIALRIQAEPRLPLARIALELGYGDHSALSQAVTRSFRVRSASLRGTLGWEWLLDRWLRAEGAESRAAA